MGTRALTLIALAPWTQTSFEELEVPTSDFVGYRVVAIVDPDDNGCGPDTYCSLPTGQCGGPGVCSIHDEFCSMVPFDPVCGCGGNTISNYCTAGETGRNVRHPGFCNP